MVSAAAATKQDTKGMGRRIGNALNLIRVARKHLSRMENKQERLEARYIQCFLEIGSQSEISYQELQKRLDVDQPVISRYIQDLGPGSFQKPGLGLIEEWRTLEDQRVKVCKLNTKGIKLLTQMLGDGE